MESIRKSQRPKKIPGHFLELAPHASNAAPRRNIKNPIRPNPLPDFCCDNCGSRYVVNPMRRGNKAAATPRYKPAPRHKIDPATQKILTLCNACGLKFKRKKKDKPDKVQLTEEEKKAFNDEGEAFAKGLANKLNSDLASRLYCSNVKKTACGCIQKFICGSESTSVEDILSRAKLLLDILTVATELRKLKCYDINNLEEKPFKKKNGKIGLGNGHRKSKEYEDYVLQKREFLKGTMKLCEKGVQKILSYSNNFLHKRMKTDPEKGIRIERQKGKAAMGTLKPICDLPLESCCIDNCVRMALTHSRLLESWRERSISSQVEARRVLAEMLTPSGGNRANCYKFIAAVTGCSNTTIGKVNEQMRNTGGDREPPEHGLKRYWKEKPKSDSSVEVSSGFVPSYKILQTAASSAGLSSVMQNIDKDSTPKRQKRQQSINEARKKEYLSPNNRFITILADTNDAASSLSNIQSIPATMLSLNTNNQYGGFISIPTGLTSSNVSISNSLSLQTFQQHLQHQQQLQLQIQILQQQLQNTQAAVLNQTDIQQNHSNAYMVTVSNHLENVNSVGTPIVMRGLSTQQPLIQNVISQSFMPNLVSSESIPSFAGHSSGAINFMSTNVDVSHSNHVSLITSPISSRCDLNIVVPNNAIISQESNVNGNLNNRNRSSRQISNFSHLHLISSQPPTMTLGQHPVTISLQNPDITNLPTMLLTQTSSNCPVTPGQLVLHQVSASLPSSGLVIHPPLSVQASSDQLSVQSVSTSQSLIESSLAISNPILPPITSFNADAFLTSGAGTYTVLNANIDSPTHSLPSV
ncbi:uncharacterized protein LOC100198790 isoform X2 [Hydra vulgaris]|uniref:Uncharacterized protein LOC100198790 isoform X2 n=1 Tax=Hydra vulgaris TaxID=6087 RepID=A0ABM4BC07_HYDVU